MTFVTCDGWHQPYLDFFVVGTLPTGCNEAFNLKRAAKRYFVKGETLFHKAFNGEPLRYVGKEKNKKILQEV